MSLANAPFLLQAANPDGDTPEARILTTDPFASNLQLTDSGPGGNFTLAPVLTLKSVAELTTPGLMVYNGANTVVTRAIAADSTITVTEPTGVTGNVILSVNDDTSVQKVNIQSQGIAAGTSANLDFIAGNNMSISAVQIGQVMHLTFNATGDGSGTVTSVSGSSNFTGLDVTVTNPTTTPNIEVALPTSGATVGKVLAIIAPNTIGWDVAASAIIENTNGISIGTSAVLPTAPTLNPSALTGIDVGNAGVTGGGGNCLYGISIGQYLTTGFFNTAVGINAFNAASNARQNVAIGFEAMNASDTPNRCIAIGAGALRGTNGVDNVAIGDNAMRDSTAATENIAIGSEVLRSSAGPNNIGIGIQTLLNTINGNNNIGIGANAVWLNTLGIGNVGVGSGALSASVDGNYNTALGTTAGSSGTNTSSSNCTYLGAGADVSTGIVTITNATAIGSNAKVGATNSMVLGGTATNGVKVAIGTEVPLYGLHLGPVGANFSATLFMEQTGSVVVNPGTPDGAILWIGTDNILRQTVTTAGSSYISGPIPTLNSGVTRGTAILNGTTAVTVSTVAAPTTADRIITWRYNGGGSGAYGVAYVDAVVPGVSFDLKSSDGTDLRHVAWWIVPGGL